MSRRRSTLAACALMLVAGVAAAQEPPAGPPGDADALAASPDAAPPLTMPSPPPGAPEVQVAVSPPEVMLGRAFTLFVTVIHPAGMQVNLPASLGLGASFEEVRRTNVARARADGLRVRDFEVELMAWDVGDLRLPPIPVTYAAEGRVRTTHGAGAAIRVISFVGDGDETLRPAAPPVSVLTRNWTLVYAAAAAAGMAVLIGLLFALRLLVRRRGRREELAQAEAVARAPDEEALARLAQLEGSGALDDPDLEPLYVALSELVRQYLGRRYGFSSLDLTSSELLAALRARPEAASAIEPVEELVAGFDLVKFAKGAAGHAQARADLERVRDLVLATRPLAAPQPAGWVEEVERG